MKPYTLVGLGAAFLLGAAVMRADTTVSTGTSTALSTGTAGNITVAGTGSVILSNSSQVISFNASATLDNSGTLQNTNAAGRTLRADTNNITVNVINRAGGRILGEASDGFQVSKANVNVSLTNSGVISVVNGGQAIDWNAITTGTNSIVNNTGAEIRSKGSDAVRIGTNGTITNSGLISAGLVMLGTGTVDSSDGIDAQDDRSGVVINNLNGGVVEGRHGITGGAVANPNYTMSVTNAAGGTIRGLNGAGINIDGLFTTAVATVVNSGVIEGKWDGVSANGDGDGVDVDGVAHITNHGTIRALSATGVGSDGLTNTADGIAIGGGTVDNRSGATISSVGRGILVDNSSQGNALAALTLANAGTITAGNGAAIGVIGAFGNSITNSAGGSITGGNAAQAAIELGSGADTVNNAGAIVSANGATHAIRLAGGDDTLNITGGSITGAIDGGSGRDTVNFDVGLGNTYMANSAMTNIEVVTVNSGTVILGAAASLGAASVRVNGGVLDLNNIALSNAITVGGGVMKGASGYTGTLTLAGNIAASGNVGGAIDTGTNAARVIDTTGGVTFTGRLAGQGVFTGGLVTVAGVHSVGNSPGLQSFADGLSYGATSTLEWEFSGDALVTRGADYDAINVTGGAFTVASGAVLKILNLGGVDYSDIAWSGDRSFLIVDATGAASFDGRFVLDLSGAGDTAGRGSWSLSQTGDGISANWTAVPEPSTYGLVAGAGVLIAAGLRRRRKANVAVAA